MKQSICDCHWWNQVWENIKKKANRIQVPIIGYPFESKINITQGAALPESSLYFLFL